MWNWITENVTALQAMVSLLSTVVWIVYLNLFLSSYQRQKRSSILISRAGSNQMGAHCIVSNMGSEPAFLVDVLAEIATDERIITASVADRLESWDEGASPSTTVSAEGPIESGGYTDIGTFEQLFDRVCRQSEIENCAHRISHVNLIAIAATNQARELVAAHRSFEVNRSEGRAPRLHPVQVEAIQIRSRHKRKKLTAILKQMQDYQAIEGSVMGELGHPRHHRLVFWRRGAGSQALAT
ncbi:hypothetical protein [Thioclava sp. GXIMD2076]|uniref:hypothetical protein n=1 Tax=Thioclava sp. GXIMD2076 TaxID=3131931 RepID=UPI0030D4AAB0